MNSKVMILVLGAGVLAHIAVAEQTNQVRKSNVVSKVVTQLPLTAIPLPGPVVFLEGTTRTRGNFGNQESGSRCNPENDIPGPNMLGRRMLRLEKATPGSQPGLLLDAGNGTIGVPTISYDGNTIYFSMAPEKDGFYHVYRMPVAGGKPEQLTSGVFHDYDPEELPDKRLVFSSTRIGGREEYHANLGSSLFTMRPDGSDITPLTFHYNNDREARVTARGTLVFQRMDTFMDRGKIEVQMMEMMPDGTGERALFCNNRGAMGFDRLTSREIFTGVADFQGSKYGNGVGYYIRQHYFGSAAPLPDGRVAALSKEGLVIAGARPPGVPTGVKDLFDISVVPDGRLLCTLADRHHLGVVNAQLDLVTPFYFSATTMVHSVVVAAPRPKPPVIPDRIKKDDSLSLKTGRIFCQSVFNTNQKHADLKRIKAVRIIESRALGLRPDHTIFGHIGSEGRELGTVPVAADGSFYVEVPADRPISVQAVDAEGRTIMNQLSWTYVRPGLVLSCVGCHNPRRMSPQAVNSGRALKGKPARLLGQGAPLRFRANTRENGGNLSFEFDWLRDSESIDSVDLYNTVPDMDIKAPLPGGRAADVKRLCERLTVGDAVQVISAVRRLGAMRSRVAASALVRVLVHADADVRMNAAMALAACGTRESVAALQPVLDDPESFVAQAAHVALEHLSGHTLMFDAYDAEQRVKGAAEWRSWLATCDWAKVEAELIDRIGGDDPVRRVTAIQTLGHIGGKAAIEALAGYLRGNLDIKAPNGDLRSMEEAMRALGHLKAEDQVELLAFIASTEPEKGHARGNSMPRKNYRDNGERLTPALAEASRKNLLFAAAVETLGFIGTPAAERALESEVVRLPDYTNYDRWANWIGCQTSPVHFRFLEALDAIGSRDPQIVPPLLRSIPDDEDHGLLPFEDANGDLLARVVQRCGLTGKTLETGLAILGDETAQKDGDLEGALTWCHQKEGRNAGAPRNWTNVLSPTPKIRAAQLMSAVMLDDRMADRIVAVLNRNRVREMSAEPVGQKCQFCEHEPDLKAARSPDYDWIRDRVWTCFYLARGLGKVRAKQAVESLISALVDDPPEAALGYHVPPSCVIHKAISPYYRASGPMRWGGSETGGRCRYC